MDDLQEEVLIPESFDPADEETKEHVEIDFKSLLEDLPALLEAMIFASPEPLTVSKVQEVFERKGFSVAAAAVQQGFSQVEELWNNPERSSGKGLQLSQIAGGYVFRTQPGLGPILRGLVEEKPARLSQAQLEVLSIISYRQPITRVEVEEIRGVDSSASMRRLLNLKLVKILGKSHGLGRPLLYGTTKHFLEFFGLNSLHDLPTLKDYQELSKSEDKDASEETSGPVTVRDLFEHDPGSVFSETTERLSVEALKSLDAALGMMQSTTDNIDVDALLGHSKEEETAE